MRLYYIFAETILYRAEKDILMLIDLTLDFSPVETRVTNDYYLFILYLFICLFGSLFSYILFYYYLFSLRSPGLNSLMVEK